MSSLAQRSKSFGPTWTVYIKY